MLQKSQEQLFWKCFVNHSWQTEDKRKRKTFTQESDDRDVPLSLPAEAGANFNPIRSCDALAEHLNRSPPCPISITQLSSIPAAMNAASDITRCGPMPRICGLSRASPRSNTSPFHCRKTTPSPTIVTCAMS